MMGRLSIALIVTLLGAAGCGSAIHGGEGPPPASKPAAPIATRTASISTAPSSRQIAAIVRRIAGLIAQEKYEEAFLTARLLASELFQGRPARLITAAPGTATATAPVPVATPESADVRAVRERAEAALARGTDP